MMVSASALTHSTGCTRAVVIAFMSSDEEAQIPGSLLAGYSVELLLEDNLLRKVGPEKLAEMLLEYRTAPAEWRYRDLFCAIGRRLIARFKLHPIDQALDHNRFDTLSDAELVALAVRHGPDFALSAAWYSPEGDLLWAAAAALVNARTGTTSNA